tara:strand:- start:211 stop:372 length:162 start_codon:yes stop_codon:yes gene_type:complete
MKELPSFAIIKPAITIANASSKLVVVGSRGICPLNYRVLNKNFVVLVRKIVNG